MHHMWVNARLRPTVRVARVLGRFPRLTRPGLNRAGGCAFGVDGGCGSRDFHSPRSTVSVVGRVIAPRVNRGARRGVMVCDGHMNAQTLERPVLDEPQLNAANRCDACGARAWVRATMPSGGQLYFCGHHANEHLPSLVGGGAQILDERHFMND